MAANDKYLERESLTGDASSSLTLTSSNQRSIRNYLYSYAGATFNPNQNAITVQQEIWADILGYTSVLVSDGRLKRTRPRADPGAPWLYAEQIINWHGKGKGVRTTSASFGAIQPPMMDPAALLIYPSYEFTVQFAPRPWNGLFSDSQMPGMQSLTWYDDASATKNSRYASEWLRYTDIETKPALNNITCKNGQMVFRDSVPKPDGPGNGQTPMTGEPRQVLPDGIVELTWYQVPYRYVTSAKSWIYKALGHVNQNDWYLWKKGQLLLVGYSAPRYQPPVPEITPYGGALASSISDNPDNLLQFSTDKLCDVTFHFLYTNRVTTTAVQGANPPHNFVASGHNLFPWIIDRKFHYLTITPPDANKFDNTKWVPAFFSFPYEMMFTDPDLVGNEG